MFCPYASACPKSDQCYHAGHHHQVSNCSEPCPFALGNLEITMAIIRATGQFPKDGCSETSKHETTGEGNRGRATSRESRTIRAPISSRNSGGMG